MAIILNSTFLDSFGNQLATPEQFAQLALPTDTLANAQAVLGDLFMADYGTGTTPATVVVASPGTTLTIGLVLNRASQPDDLLNSNWSARQAALADQDAVWTLYGADPATYAEVREAVRAIVGDGPLTAATDAGYISTVDDRTIWMTLDPERFNALFGTDMLSVQDQAGDAETDWNITQYNLAWGGNLSLPDDIAIHVAGLWVEQNGDVDENYQITNPAVLNSTGIDLVEGPLGVGNSALAADRVHATSIALTDAYNFPLDADKDTPTVALVEGNVPVQQQLFSSYNAYRTSIGLTAVTSAKFQVMSGPDDLTSASSGELTLDISVVAGAAPKSTQLLYANLGGTAFNAYQQAFFDRTNQPGVLTSSYSIFGQPTAGSPFANAFQQLFVDGLLNNVSVHIAAGDQGSSGNLGNGVANVATSLAPALALIVGGTSIADRNAAQSDPMLANLVSLALQNDPATVFQLVSSGLRTLPTNLSDVSPTNPANTLTSMFESVWNGLVVGPQPGTSNLQVGLGQNSTGSGGADVTQPVPSYQSDFGLTPTSSTGTGRGTPDVSALSSGDTVYAVLNPNYVDDPSKPLITLTGGTSAATPLWASLTAQFDAIFADQGLPRLGFYNDLLYTAAAITPASFNDIVLGNNVTSYYAQDGTGYYNSNLGVGMMPTGDGYQAAPGYDLASGIGTPNGVVLARALSAIAHAQSYSTAPAVIEPVDAFGGTSAVAQTLLVQNSYYNGSGLLVQVDGTAATVMQGNSALGWTNQLAGQSVQGSNFDPGLVLLFDKAAKSIPYEISVSAGDSLGVMAGSDALALYQAALTNDFGFVQYGDASGGITLARPLAIAQTAGGASDQNAVVRLRQNGQDSLSLEIYRVDDFTGRIGALEPGQAGYAEAAAARGYRTVSDATVINGPGYGAFAQVEITDVDAGDLMAMKLTNATTGNTYWAFSQANGGSPTPLFSYGLNTWGWEDRPVTGDYDYNDLIVQLDFTSTAGRGWLV